MYRIGKYTCTFIYQLTRYKRQNYHQNHWFSLFKHWLPTPQCSFYLLNSHLRSAGQPLLLNLQNPSQQRENFYILVENQQREQFEHLTSHYAVRAHFCQLTSKHYWMKFCEQGQPQPRTQALRSDARKNWGTSFRASWAISDDVRVSKKLQNHHTVVCVYSPNRMTWHGKIYAFLAMRRMKSFIFSGVTLCEKLGMLGGPKHAPLE